MLINQTDVTVKEDEQQFAAAGGENAEGAALNATQMYISIIPQRSICPNFDDDFFNCYFETNYCFVMKKPLLPLSCPFSSFSYPPPSLSYQPDYKWQVPELNLNVYRCDGPTRSASVNPSGLDNFDTSFAAQIVQGDVVQTQVTCVDIDFNVDKHTSVKFAVCPHLKHIPLPSEDDIEVMAVRCIQSYKNNV
jgi:hypothetical protein